MGEDEDGTCSLFRWFNHTAHLFKTKISFCPKCMIILTKVVFSSLLNLLIHKIIRKLISLFSTKTVQEHLLLVISLFPFMLSLSVSKAGNNLFLGLLCFAQAKWKKNQLILVWGSSNHSQYNSGIIAFALV